MENHKNWYSNRQLLCSLAGVLRRITILLQFRILSFKAYYSCVRLINTSSRWKYAPHSCKQNDPVDCMLPRLLLYMFCQSNIWQYLQNWWKMQSVEAFYLHEKSLHSLCCKTVIYSLLMFLKVTTGILQLEILLSKKTFICIIPLRVINGIHPSDLGHYGCHCSMKKVSFTYHLVTTQ